MFLNDNQIMASSVFDCFECVPHAKTGAKETDGKIMVPETYLPGVTLKISQQTNKQKKLWGE